MLFVVSLFVSSITAVALGSKFHLFLLFFTKEAIPKVWRSLENKVLYICEGGKVYGFLLHPFLLMANKAKKNTDVKDVLQWIHSLYSSLSAEISEFQANGNSLAWWLLLFKFCSTIKGFFPFFFSCSHPAFRIALIMTYWNKKLMYLWIDFKVAVSLACLQAAGPPLSSHII